MGRLQKRWLCRLWRRGDGEYEIVCKRGMGRVEKTGVTIGAGEAESLSRRIRLVSWRDWERLYEALRAAGLTEAAERLYSWIEVRAADEAGCVPVYDTGLGDVGYGVNLVRELAEAAIRLEQYGRDVFGIYARKGARRWQFLVDTPDATVLCRAETPQGLTRAVKTVFEKRPAYLRRAAASIRRELREAFETCGAMDLRYGVSPRELVLKPPCQLVAELRVYEYPEIARAMYTPGRGYGPDYVLAMSFPVVNELTDRLVLPHSAPFHWLLDPSALAERVLALLYARYFPPGEKEKTELPVPRLDTPVERRKVFPALVERVAKYVPGKGYVWARRLTALGRKVIRRAEERQARQPA